MSYRTTSSFIILSFLSFNACKHNIALKKDQETENVLSLKNTFQNDFLIGAALSNKQIKQSNSLEIQFIKNNFNTITPENDMKWEEIHPEENVYNFDVADTYVALGETNKMNTVGHTLIWHSQLAPWMHKVDDSTVMAKHIENHINTIVTRYKGKINTWDVVNEALNEDGSLRESIFLKVMGEEYIEYAFKLAEKADPDAELVYNDYNLWKPKKRGGVVKLVKQLQSRGIKISAVGMQAHWSLLGPSLEDIENSIIAYSELGVKVMFTELDITVLPNPWDLNGAAVEQSYEQYENDPSMNPFLEKLSDSAQEDLAKRYEAIFKLFLKHKDKISRVTFWGINDGQSWLNNWPIKGRTNHPLLFDRNSQPKKAYYKVLALKNKN